MSICPLFLSLVFILRIIVLAVQLFYCDLIMLCCRFILPIASVLTAVSAQLSLFSL